MVTFDEGGVSGHHNHRSAYLGVRWALLSFSGSVCFSFGGAESLYGPLCRQATQRLACSQPTTMYILVSQLF